MLDLQRKDDNNQAKRLGSVQVSLRTSNQRHKQETFKVHLLPMMRNAIKGSLSLQDQRITVVKTLQNAGLILVQILSRDA